jgi:hypothetical protein
MVVCGFNPSVGDHLDVPTEVEARIRRINAVYRGAFAGLPRCRR